LATVDVAASYRSPRVGGDYFEFIHVAPSRLLLVLLDVAGSAAQAMPITAAVQEFVHKFGPKIFAGQDGNEADAIAEMTLLLNRTVLAAAGAVCHTPAFIASYNDSVGVLTYINAGHTPGLLRHGEKVELLPANGVPLGLFSHSTHDAQMAALAPGSTVLLVSRGLVEFRRGRTEFGLERLRNHLTSSTTREAAKLCKEVLDQVSHFAASTDSGVLGKILQVTRADRFENDVTAVVLARYAAAASVGSS